MLIINIYNPLNMSEEQKKVSAVAKKQKKVIEQWAETKDPYVNALYKKLRNN